MDRLKRPWTYENYKGGEITIKKDTYDKLLARWNEPVTPNVTVVNKGVNRPTEHYVTTGNIRSTSMPYNAYPWRGVVLINLRAMKKIESEYQIQYDITENLQRLFPGVSLDEMRQTLHFSHDIKYAERPNDNAVVKLTPAVLWPQDAGNPYIVFNLPSQKVVFTVYRKAPLKIQGNVYVAPIASGGVDDNYTAWLDKDGALKLSSEYLGFAAPKRVPIDEAINNLTDERLLDMIKDPLSHSPYDVLKFGAVYIKQYQRHNRYFGKDRRNKNVHKRYRTMKFYRGGASNPGIVETSIAHLRRYQVYRLYMPKRRDTDNGYFVLWRYRKGLSHIYKAIDYKREPKRPDTIRRDAIGPVDSFQVSTIVDKEP